MSALVASVGDKGKNQRQDVVTVQTLLKAKGFDLGAVNGVCTASTVAAIRKYQATLLSHPDGHLVGGVGGFLFGGLRGFARGWTGRSRIHAPPMLGSRWSGNSAEQRRHGGAAAQR